MNERRTTQPFGPFFPLIFTVAKWICRLLHPVTVQGLVNLPRHGALLVANHASNWDPLVLATALPMDYRLRVMGSSRRAPPSGTASAKQTACRPTLTAVRR